MPSVREFTVTSSDGAAQYSGAGGNIPNEPDHNKRSDSHARIYSLLALDHPRSEQWRQKLGDLIKDKFGYGAYTKQPESLSPLLTDIDQRLILKEFPDSYTLWEHSVEDSRSQVGLGRNGNRSDIYLYGHPGGRTKRFRSPMEFYLHLEWLCCQNGDCLCKHCRGKEIEAESVGGSKQSDNIMGEGGIVTISNPKLPSETRSLEQKFDAEPKGTFMYRPGELVWFNKGSAWGLAVICRRQVMISIPRYLLQPLSHPLKQLPPLIKDQELIRPWLAWSVPNTTHSQIAHLIYDQVPWARVLNGEVGPGDAEVDGSILAAKRVDASYTFFDRVNMPAATPGDVYYTGMFLGAEKIWVGEPVRCRTPNDEIVVMVLHQIIETIAGGPAPDVILVGDIYKFVEMPTPYKSRTEWPNPDLPVRMVSDLRFRNEVADKARRGIWYEWRLLETMARKPLTVVKGRWYETQLLLPILRGVEFHNEISKGVTSDAGGWMNGRGDGTIGAGQRRKNRMDTLGRSVPQGLKISRGFNGPQQENVIPMELPNTHIGHGAVNESQYESVGTIADVEMERFMNLDHPGEVQGWVPREV